MAKIAHVSIHRPDGSLESRWSSLAVDDTRKKVAEIRQKMKTDKDFPGWTIRIRIA